MKILWTGTDSLMLLDYSKRPLSIKIWFWFFRRAIRILERFVSHHLVNSSLVEKNLLTFKVKKPIEYIETPLKYTKKLPKIPHEGINILYYMPKGFDVKFKKWLYGYDIFLNLQDKIDANWIVVDGSQDLAEIYPIVDFYLRPNRHDGNSRLIRECDIQNIPYYYSTQNPSLGKAIMSIKYHRNYENNLHRS